MPFNLKVSGVWKIATPFVRVTGAWKSAQVWLRVSGVWKIITQVFTPPSGTYGASTLAPTTAQYTLTAISATVWTYTNTVPSVGTSVDIASGASANSITFSLVPPGVTGIRVAQWTVTGTNTATGQVANFTINLDAERP